MISRRTLLTRATRAASTALKPTLTSTTRTLTLTTLTRPQPLHHCPSRRTPPSRRLLASHTPSLVRWASSKATADEIMEEITELYATAKDEFEIAAEETTNNTVYAEGDRAAAREELTKLQDAYTAVLEGPDKDVADEIKRRVGNRIRELESAVLNMEEMALHQD